MRKPVRFAVVTVLAILASHALGQRDPSWKVFASRSGWSIGQPSDWRVASCRSCNDPKAPGVFVDFFPPHTRATGGWVMVQPLESKPSRASADAWLTEISKTANLNQQIETHSMALNGAAALRVRYRTADDQQMEEVYVVAGAKTFSVTFSGEQSTPRRPLDTLANYPVFLKMLESFRVGTR